MEKAVSTNVTENIDRRLHPVRLSIGHLNRLLEGTRSGTVVSINRDLLLSIVSTIEIFIEDFETAHGKSGGSTEDRKVAEKIGDAPRVTQSRVS